MDCRQAEQLLSHYHDDELLSDLRTKVEAHLECCPSCAGQLAEMRLISQAAKRLTKPRPPDDLWDRISAQLSKAAPPVTMEDESDHLRLSHTHSPYRRFVGGFAIAATMLLGLGIIWNMRPAQGPIHHHDALDSYVQLFTTNPVMAQQQLASAYSGKTISADQAVRLVGYRPRNVDEPPAGITCDRLVVLDMPCCKCVQAVWQRDDQSYLAVFEHNSEMNDWFDSHPSVHIDCQTTRCRLTDLGGQLAATWRVGKRVITVVGVRDVEELGKLVGVI